MVIERVNKDNLEDIMTVANMMYEWWGKEDNLTYEIVKEIVSSYCSNEDFPIVLVAKDKNRVVGTVTLLANDTRLRQDLYPMISSLYVIEEYRNKGIGSLLVKTLLDYAKGRFKVVYLMTCMDGFYEKLNFKFVEKTKAFVVRGEVQEEKLYKFEF